MVCQGQVSMFMHWAACSAVRQVDDFRRGVPFQDYPFLLARFTLELRSPWTNAATEGINSKIMSIKRLVGGSETMMRTDEDWAPKAWN